ncbi:hypothetical protein [Mesobacillus subterraneus]|uniref:hypothetical protein n=1 Tax=Mesobacillus subterraneus TaxID=285983 RepID=UPI0014730501|nr:hypothetical protein [Mesobacillus subterraneus]
MKKGFTVFFIGLIMYMAGIYLSTIWTAPGAALGVLGGILMGASTYFYVMNRKRQS